MLFLGAGASNAVGIGQLSDLTRKVISKLNSKGYSEQIAEIMETIKKKNENCIYYHDNEIDIEVLLTIINKEADRVRSLKELGPYAIYCSELSSNKINNFKTKDILKIRNIITKEIIDHCISFDKQRTIKFYSEILNIGKEIAEFRTHNGHTYTRPFSHIVTVNYDLVMEYVFEKVLDISHRRGLKSETAEEEPFLDLDRILFNELHSNEEINLLKIHGSIDWRIRDYDKKIIRRDTSYSLRGLTAKEPLMIYPIYEKKLSEKFYYSMYYYFKKILRHHEIYIIIGYSFRDNSINEAFYYGLKDHSASRMIVITTNTTVIDRINTVFSDCRNKIEIINTKFGSSDLQALLRNSLT
jgi:hypothetical protein